LLVSSSEAHSSQKQKPARIKQNNSADDSSLVYSNTIYFKTKHNTQRELSHSLAFVD
jgi:hypothetical protein